MQSNKVEEIEKTLKKMGLEAPNPKNFWGGERPDFGVEETLIEEVDKMIEELESLKKSCYEGLKDPTFDTFMYARKDGVLKALKELQKEIDSVYEEAYRIQRGPGYVDSDGNWNEH